ncbi:MAG: hypothetical protein JRH16_11775 [Deltaproteobacteria bacterium]|nr:hypothetical protein [Deltaproteobacteria bacterium]
MSIRLCAIVTLGKGSDDSLVSEVAETLGGAAGRVDAIEQSHAGVHLPGCVGAGDLTWDFLVSDAAALEALSREAAEQETWRMLGALGDEDLARRAGCGYSASVLEPFAASASQPAGFGIKRTNLVRIRPGSPSSAVSQWCREVPLLADHVPAIRNWSLSRVVGFVGDPAPVAWTHAWEQDFETIEGLHEDYMLSPYHWGHLDGWYDPEMPWSIVEPELAHLFCPASESVLCWPDGVGSSRGGPEA